MIGLFKHAASGLACAIVVGLTTTAHAFTLVDLPPLEGGNIAGVAYRPSDGHFLLSQEFHIQGARGAAAVHELDAQGTVVRTTMLDGVDPNLQFAGSLNLSEAGDKVYLATAHVDPGDPNNFVNESVTLSGDLTQVIARAPTLPEFFVGQVSDDQVLGFDLDTHTVSMLSRATGDVRKLDLFPQFGNELGCLSICVRGIAASWNGGFFTIEDGQFPRLKEFDAEGHLKRVMHLDSETFGYHPMAIDTDMAGERIFLVMNNVKLVTITDEQFVGAIVPEPGTWGLMAMGVALMPLARRRALGITRVPCGDA